MKVTQKFAPIFAIVGLLVIVAFGGVAVANNNSVPDVSSRQATVSITPETTTRDDAPSSPSPEPAPSTPPAEPAPPAQPVQPAQPAIAPPAPLNYQPYYDGDDDDWDEGGDDD